MLVHPMGKDVHINKKPLPESTFPGAPESGVQVFLAAVAMQRQPDPEKTTFTYWIGL
jgi:hypothetical protein